MARQVKTAALRPKARKAGGNAIFVFELPDQPQRLRMRGSTCSA